MSEHKAHVNAFKKDIVKELAAKLRKASVIGVVDMQNLPAAQLLGLKKALRGKIELFMTKQRLMQVAVDEVKAGIPGLDKLFEKRTGMPALLFTTENPFSIYKSIKKSKSPAPAKAGQLAPRDITVSAGPTPFSPGPVMSELGALGIKAGVENGKVTVKSDTVVVREGQPISANLASMMLRLGIQPMEIGLNVVAVLEKGTVYDRKVLDIDEKQFAADLAACGAAGINLAVDIGYMTRDTRDIILAKAYREAKALSIETAFVTKETAGDILAKATAQAVAVKEEAKL
jgi:large subunit ribosomal protein L10